MILDKVWYHKYDWITVRSKSIESLTVRCLELKDVAHGYKVYKCVDINDWPMKVVLWRDKGYKPEDHWSNKLAKTMEDWKSELEIIKAKYPNQSQSL